MVWRPIAADADPGLSGCNLQETVQDCQELRHRLSVGDCSIRGRAVCILGRQKPEAGSVKIELDAASIDAGSDEANVELVKRGWMDAAKFPKVTFASTAVKALAGGRFEVTGKMSIKGITRDIAAPFTAKPQGSAQLFEGAFVLKRLEFKIGEGPWSDTETVADEVQIRFKVLASPTPK